MEENERRTPEFRPRSVEIRYQQNIPSDYNIIICQRVQTIVAKSTLICAKLRIEFYPVKSYTGVGNQQRSPKSLSWHIALHNFEFSFLFGHVQRR